MTLFCHVVENFKCGQKVDQGDPNVACCDQGLRRADHEGGT